MIKKIAWDTFKNTGDINAFLEFKQIELIENQMKEVQGRQLEGMEQMQNQQIQEQIKGE